MNERVKFIAPYLQQEAPFSASCEQAGIRRKTGNHGSGAMTRAPWRRSSIDPARSHPHAVSSAVIQRMVATRHRHHRWDPRKRLAVLRRHESGRTWLVASAVGNILRQQGLVRRRRHRRCSAS
jgi:putative transposase